MDFDFLLHLHDTSDKTFLQMELLTGETCGQLLNQSNQSINREVWVSPEQRQNRSGTSAKHPPEFAALRLASSSQAGSLGALGRGCAFATSRLLIAGIGFRHLASACVPVWPVISRLEEAVGDVRSWLLAVLPEHREAAHLQMRPVRFCR